jgi:hypothetical protein
MRKLFFSLILLIATSVSGQIAISNLPTFNSVSDSAWVPAVIGSTTYKIRGAKLKTTSTLQEVLNASSTFSKSNYINAFAKTLSVYNADSIVLQSNNSIYLNATSGDVISQSLKANHNAYNNNHAFVTYNSSTGALKQSSLDSLIAYIKRQIPAYALTAGYATTLTGSYPTQTISVDSSIIASKSFANAGFNTKLNIADTAGFATRSWSNNVHPRFDGTYNNPTWLNTLHSDKIVNYSATPFQALVSDGNGFFVPYTIPYVSTFDTAAMLANYLRKHDIAGVSGRVPFYTGTNTLSSDSAFRWDNTNKRLGVNITPLDRVHIGANKINALPAPDAVGLIVQDLTSSTIGVGGAIQFRGFHNGTVASTVSGVINTIKENATNGDFSFAMGFHTRLNGNSQWPERVRITGDGNLLVNTSTNAGFRADINGTARIVSKLTQPTTANSPKGTATLVNGVVTVNNTLATTGCFIQINYRAGTALSSTSSILTVSSLINNTSFTVTAYTPGAATTNTSDNNTIEYTISN